jgi:(p)ppGpp synthase/HD superfamily hydrolase
MSLMPDAYSRHFDRALVVAALVHRQARRKGTIVPYVIHPVHVAVLLLRHGYGDPIATAAVLHDVIEDVDYSDAALQLALRAAFPRAGLPDGIQPPDEYRRTFDGFLAREFADDVLDLVRQMTEPKNDGGPERPWRERKEPAVAHLATGPDEYVALKAADALHNVRSILEDIEYHGAAVLARFKAPPADVLWYYRSIAERVIARLGPVPIAHELGRGVDALAAFVASLPEAS